MSVKILLLSVQCLKKPPLILVQSKMAMSKGASKFVPKLEIEAMQTVPTFKTTDPRQICEVSIEEPVGPDIFRGCLNIVLYYNKAAEEDSGWLVAGWIRESLSRALMDQPMLGGRLRRGGDGNGGQLEMVSNDSGVRVVETKIEITMKDFLGLNKERENSEAELVFWEDIDDQNPQYSPLCYVQVTNFQCGGYSIGISCSLLLADLLIMNDFLLRWTSIQKDLLSNNDVPKQPIFYLPNLKNTSLTPATSIISSGTPSKNYGQTMIFKIAGKIDDLKNEPSKKAAALICIEEAECKLGREMSTRFSFFVKESPDVIKVQNCKKQELVNSGLNLRSHEVVSSSSLDDVGIKELAFHEDNKPASVSCWIGSVTDGLVMAVPSHNDELHVVVTIPI